MARAAALPAASRAAVATKRDPAALVYALTEIFLVLYVVLAFGAYNGIGAVSFLMLGLLGCGCLAISPRLSVARMPVSGWLVLMLVWIAASYSWSANIYQTKYHLRIEILLSIGAAGAAAILPFERFKRTLLRGIYAAVGLTIFALVTVPTSRAQFNRAGAEDLAGWHGYFVHKNAMTAFLAFALATVLAFEPNRRRRRWFAVVTFVMMIGGSSGTGLSAYLIIGAIWMWMGMFERESVGRRSSFMVLSTILLVVFAAFVFATLPIIVNLYGKDLTFTGRTKIWDGATWAIARQPLTGYGRGGVWTNGGLQPTASMVRIIGFAAGHAHNSYLEVLLETGLVGLVLYIGMIVAAWRAAWRQLGVHSDVARWGIGAVAGYLMFTVSESVVFGPWFVMLVWIFMLGRSVGRTPGTSSSARSGRW